MFEINEHSITNSSLPIISHNYEILHFDEFPILFWGTNEFGNKVIGSLACEDEEDDNLFRYFHTIISNKVFNQFLNNEITYRDILKNSKSTFILDKDINDRTLFTYQIPISTIPDDYLPLKNSFCPELGFKMGFNYSMSLQGLKADIHEASTSTLKKVSDYFLNILNSAVDSLKELKLKSEINSKPSTVGSFKVNYIIKLPGYQNLFLSPDEISDYISKYIGYSVDSLHKEIDTIHEDKLSNEAFFHKLNNLKNNLYIKNSLVIDEKKSKSDLVHDLYESLEKVDKLSKEIGHGFKEIEIISKKNQSETEIPIAFINQSKAYKISEAADLVLGKDDDTEHIPEAEYSICIYHLNLFSRTGNAYIHNTENPDFMDKPKLKIVGGNELAQSKYTESLHFNKWISVKATAKKSGSKFKYLMIIPDSE